MSVEFELAHVIVEPARLKILRCLREKARYISQIADCVSMDRSTVSYHLGVLEKNGIIDSEYTILVQPASPGKAADRIETPAR